MKKVYKDIFLSVVATFIFTATNQLIVYPFLGSRLSNGDFGIMLTIIGIVNAISVIFGGSLNNSRLLLNNDYRENNINGEFKRLFLLCIILSIISSGIGLIFFIHQVTLITYIELLILTILISIRSYLTIAYRIKLNYVFIVLHMLITSFGYIIGVVSFYFINDWVLVFLVGEIFSLVFLICTINFKLVPRNSEKLYNEAIKNYSYLISSNAVSNILLYMDRLLINPILGPANVAIYYAGSIVGKISGIVLQPLSGVLLSYLSINNKSNSWSNFKKVLILSLGLGIGIYIITIPITPFFIEFLYADLSANAKAIYNLANLATIILISSNLLQPVTLKYCPLWWQTLIQLVYAVTYIGLGIIFMINFGLVGFVYSSIIANVLRYLMLIGLGYKYIKP